MMSQLMTQDSLLGHLPGDVQEEVKDILARILKLAGYRENSNTDSNSVGGTNFQILIPASDLLKAMPFPTFGK
jgi:hypothetical protein